MPASRRKGWNWPLSTGSVDTRVTFVTPRSRWAYCRRHRAIGGRQSVGRKHTRRCTHRSKVRLTLHDFSGRSSGSTGTGSRTRCAGSSATPRSSLRSRGTKGRALARQAGSGCERGDTAACTPISRHQRPVVWSEIDLTNTLNPQRWEQEFPP